MRSVNAILVAVALSTSAVVDACVGETFTPIVELRSSQPLLASPAGDDTYVVAVDAGGCVKSHFPVFDTRAGTYSYRLDLVEFEGLKRELGASGLMQLDAAAVKRDLRQRDARKAAQGQRDGYYVRDEEILEFLLLDAAVGGKSTARQHVVWTGLREQLLNHPDQDELVGIAAVRDRLKQLSTDGRMQRVQP